MGVSMLGFDLPENEFHDVRPRRTDHDKIVRFDGFQVNVPRGSMIQNVGAGSMEIREFGGPSYRLRVKGY